MPEKGKKMGRRNVLKTLGAAVIVPGIATVGSAQSGFEQHLEEARRLRRQKQDNDRFVSFLRKKGYGVSSNTVTETHTHNSGGDLSTQKLSSSDLSASINIVADHIHCDPDPYRIYAEYYFDWSVDSGFGEPEKDLFSFAWPADAFQYREDSQQSSSNVSFDTRGNQLNGISFKFDDTGLYGGDHEVGYGGCYISKESGWSDSTTFAGKYIHTYQSSEICGVSFSSDGEMSFTLCNEGEKDAMGHTQTDYSEVEHNYTNC